MIIFKDYRGFEQTSYYLNNINEYLNLLEMNSSLHYSKLISLLLEVAELETGITDTVSIDVDRLTPLVKLCHEMTNISAEMVYETWVGKLFTNDCKKQIRNIIKEIADCDAPRLIPACIPEGFAFYGLYPEMYMEAAEQFFLKRTPEKIVCVGLRTIGTVLAALVEVVLKKKGCTTWSFTLRPKGHPYNRSVEFTAEIRDRLIQLRNSWFLVIDEGPGLSGSSICGTLEKLIEIRIPAEKIVIFPSWNPDANRFVSEKAKRLWPLFDKFTTDFTDVWITNCKLQKIFDMEIIGDFSAGRWRETVIKDEFHFPAVYSHHERRKYLLLDNQCNRYIAKWIGLGKYGDALLTRAKILADNNFSPPVRCTTYGFAVSPFVEGCPLRSDDVSQKLFEFAADYFCFIKSNFPSKLSTSYEKFNEMIHSNVFECLGSSYDVKLKAIDLFPKNVYENNVVAVDGRVMPHEWLWTGDRYYKVDQLEHHCDQFFPGCQNIAWDIAAFCIEFSLDQKAEHDFIDCYVQRDSDRHIYELIPYFRIAYLAYRLGYVSSAANSLFDTMDGNRFVNEIEKYKRILLKDLNTI